MPSGERIQFGSNVNFIFETDSLSCASPATVSRMGIILVSEQDLSVQEIINHWLEEHTGANPNMLIWIQDHLYRLELETETVQPRKRKRNICLDWIWAKGILEVSLSNTSIVQNALSLLWNVTSRDEFLVALYRGLAPNLSPELRNEFAFEVQQFTFNLLLFDDAANYKTNENLPDSLFLVVFREANLPVKENPGIVYYDKRADSLTIYTDEVDMQLSNEQMLSSEKRPFVLTATAQANRDIVGAFFFISFSSLTITSALGIVEPIH
ncbi:unnamed protein product [Gongylonema pulchrum]|uniref:FBA_2 domain-containing protein n=1 Tax=Gongylonema pulchrum TaxID=637853 RepID=A0A183DN54_9BILA|nr:unnamed protein product [Gongylonema pulchrum]